MDASLQIDRHRNMQNMKHALLHVQPETASDAQSYGTLEHATRRSGSENTKQPQHIASDIASSFPPETKVTSPNAQAWQHSSPALAPAANPPSQENAHIDATAASDEGTKKESGIARQKTLGHKRAPSTNAPTVHPLLGLDDAQRRRSRSIGSSLRDPRIAAVCILSLNFFDGTDLPQLSAQLRSRLSYAAAKVEKKRQSQASNHLLHHRSSTPILSAEALSRGEHPLSIGDIEGQRSAANASPNGTTVSAPDAPATSSIYPLEAPALSSPVSVADGMYPPSQPDPQKRSAISTTEDLVPRLAPPADITSGRLNGQRRRPNPNDSVNSARLSPFPLHRRQHSQQELQNDSEFVLVPETPPLRPRGHQALASYNGLAENSQSSSMEQDAIETLLFMSSPGTSGYHSNSQNSQNTLDTMNIDGAWRSVQTPRVLSDSQASSSNPARADSHEARAGDEIDMMLDQMDSDSDDGANYSSRSGGVS
ncbi:hypothetical protein ASPCAL00150 [Aspergillus calidoustus]|uniref:Uncharacterized protein n=1 Tax=Aspergillus calidoustus TaxID=454130 RepID=A0A0U5FPL5_ASPCI|nr:hypothetical protein ASPCAL00150 [Aspergillus calidoustus]